MYPNPVQKNPPSTVAGFRQDAEAAFRRKNPAATSARILWTRKPRPVTFPTGKTGFIGEITVTGNCYQSRRFTVTLCGTTLMAS
jgi:hypothetical protein